MHKHGFDCGMICGLAVYGTAVLTLAGCSDGTSRRVGDLYERNNMPSASPGTPAGPHSINTDSTGDFTPATPTR